MLSCAMEEDKQGHWKWNTREVVGEVLNMVALGSFIKLRRLSEDLRKVRKQAMQVSED